MLRFGSRRFGARPFVASSTTSRRSSTVRLPVPTPVARAARAAFEPLEGRTMLSISWANKGTAIVDTDGFNAAYGANSTIARNIVQRAIDDWELVVTDFNQSGGGNFYSVDISAADLGPGTRGSTGGILYDALDKPTTANITLDNNGGGTGWYFDSVVGTATVPDDGEFTDLDTPFQANAAVAGFDLYRTAAHELGHAMGLSSSSPLLTAIDVNIGDDPLDGGSADLFTINVDGVAGVDYTYTNAGGFHLFEGVAPGATSHPDELMNSGRTGVVGRRQLISNTIASLLRDAYDYTVTLPSNINTFCANLNTSTNVLTINGDADEDDNDADIIDLEVAGTAMRFEVNSTSETIEGAQFTTINVLAGLANDDIDVDALLASETLTVNGDAGNDSVDVAVETDDIDNIILSNFTFNGGANTDTLRFNDTLDGPGSDTYEFTSTIASKSTRDITYSTVETIIINGSGQASTYTINGLAADLTINAGALNDTINVGGTTGDIDSAVNGDVQVNGNAGTDTVHFNDVNDDASVDDSYTLTSVGFDKSSTTEIYGFATVENVILTAGLADNVIDVWSMSSVTSPSLATLVVNGNDGNDAINMGLGDLDDGFAFVDVTVNGQVGTDSLYLDDLTDDTGNDTYTLTSTTFDKNSPGIALWTYGTMESLTLDANGFNNVINVDTLSVPGTIRANGGIDTINIANGDVDNNILNNMSVDGGIGSDTMVFDDTTDGATQDDWAVTSTAVVKNFAVNRTFNYSALEGITINANAHDNNYEITSTLSTTPVVINGGVGNELFGVGSPGNNAVNVDGALTLNGNGGTDRLEFNDQANAAVVTYTVASTTVARSSAALTTYGTMEGLTINGGTAGDTINVTSTLATTPLTANGNGGDDTMIVATAGDWDATVLGNVTFNGGAGANDLLRINDTADAGADNYTVSNVQTSKSSIASTINYATVENYTLEANAANNTITVNNSFAAPFRVNGNGGVDTFNLVSNAAGSFVTIDGGTGLDNVNVNSDGAGVASGHFVNTQDLAALTILAGGTAVMETNGNRLLETDALTIAATGTLDLTDNDMIVDYAGASQLAVIQALMNLGRNGGAWNGNGITSSAAGLNPTDNTTLGAMESSEYDALYTPATTFGGVDPDATAVLVKYTYYGDTDFNGTVDFDDYVRTDAGFNGGVGGWTNGDSDGTGGVDFDDYALLDLAFNTQTGVL